MQRPAKLVQIVREATSQYIDVNNATAAGYGPFLGCISGSDHGAMGIHYVNPTLVGSGEIDATHPQALIYEPSNGKMRLVGVEFIVDSGDVAARLTRVRPFLKDKLFYLSTARIDTALAPFFELHVWAWRDNPQGAFVDWNNHVTCEGMQ